MVENSYNTAQRECLPALCAFLLFRPYMKGHEFIIHIDKDALNWAEATAGWRKFHSNYQHLNFMSGIERVSRTRLLTHYRKSKQVFTKISLTGMKSY